jgi:hypothetical protein
MDNSNQDKNRSKTESSVKDINAKTIKLALLGTFSKLRTTIEQGFISGLLLVAVISLAVYGYEKLTSNSYISGISFNVWQISLIFTAVMLSLVVGVGLPILWGKRAGFKRVLGIISWEFIFVAIAVVITAFVLNSKNRNSNTDCTGSLNSSYNCVLPDTNIFPSQQ